MGNVTPSIGGSWREGSGRIWQSTQNGNSFQWIQQGTNRMATGTLVSTKVSPTSVSDWAIHITFDGNVHWRLTSSPDGNTLYGMGDNFYRASSSANFSQPSVYNVNGLNHGMVASSVMNQQNVNTTYTENSGKSWTITSCPHAGYFTMRNQQDGRSAEFYVIKDISSNKHTMYIQFQGTQHPLRAETYDMNNIPLSNGDVFRCTMQSMQPTTVNTGYGVSIGNSGISVSFTTPSTIIPPTYNPPMNPNYPPQQPFSQPQPFTPPQPFGRPQPFGQPQPFSQPQPYGQPQVYMQTTPVTSSSLANTIITACQGKSFDSDKMKILVTYSTSQISPMGNSDLIRIISLFNFESDKVKAVQQLKKTNNIATMDCSSTCLLVRSFAHDNNKDTIIRDLCPFIWDRRQNCETLVSCLSFASSQNRLRDFILKN
ncbi:predicted protein [Naegleria gruberi]|uniref:Predicted protein n=1 Tax=Naegleria gruberi TaxID=5762 RepID=D2VSJ9_NAEGR|nr:uncharacterized protein NAEGRDRAFT_51924 [Naegleria gruberi]EFC40205.1 predicted protein [Naegleria gruberi]|eukprot:XP_002672949.1 predicted protein [Naegleria gruberi strain NEG-M]